MDSLVKIESWIVSKVKGIGGGGLKNALGAFADYRMRHLNEGAAAMSFYAIFSVFPLLAFSAYLVSAITGKDHAEATVMVIKILTDFVPGLQDWIQEGLYTLVMGTSVHNWFNAFVLGWAALGFFSATNGAIHKVPVVHHAHHKSYTENTFLAGVTLILFASLLSAVIFTEYMSSADHIPQWFLFSDNKDIQNLSLFLVKSGAFLGVTAILTTATLYYILIPSALKIRHALLGGCLFSGLLVACRTGYWIYMHYNKEHIEHAYGVFSTYILIMLWLHFVSNCFVYSCLYAHHLHKNAESHKTKDLKKHLEAA